MTFQQVMCSDPNFEYDEEKGVYGFCTSCTYPAWSHFGSDPAADFRNILEDMRNWSIADFTGKKRSIPTPPMVRPTYEAIPIIPVVQSGDIVTYEGKEYVVARTGGGPNRFYINLTLKGAQSEPTGFPY